MVLPHLNRAMPCPHVFKAYGLSIFNNVLIYNILKSEIVVIISPIGAKDIRQGNALLLRIIRPVSPVGAK
jgi:hypothetical protein